MRWSKYERYIAVILLTVSLLFLGHCICLSDEKGLGTFAVTTLLSTVYLILVFERKSG